MLFSHFTLSDKARGKRLAFTLFCLGFGSATHVLAVTTPPSPKELRQRLLRVADDILDNANISYVYGGNSLGSEQQCQQCNRCLAERNPSPQKRLILCPDCRACSLDCSHFIQEVFRQAGVRVPYANTDLMLSLSPEALYDRYGYRPVTGAVDSWLPGDLLVYQGHVVMLEKNLGSGYGSIVHATGGKDVRGPGQGVQRESMAALLSFRGELLRVLRHKSLGASLAASQHARQALPQMPAPAKATMNPTSGLREKRLRPIKPRGLD